MIQDDEFVEDLDAGLSQICNRANNLSRLHVAAIVILANHENTGMRSAGLKHQIMKIFEIVVIPGQEYSFRLDRMQQMHGIVFPV
jgi:hypothetical protein